jgi:prepilin-type N-terminal cleavage/methylation domain-containing protein/prepilin-type processing-associated H-X9-DG protein
MRHKQGFTLIELLVVIAVIALLLSILVPSLSKAKEYAKSVICKSNMHSYALAGEAYLSENKNSFPHPIVCIDGRATFTSAYVAIHPKECRWHDEGVQPQGPFWPYLDMNKVNTCPTFTSVAKSRIADHQAYLAGIGGNVSLCSSISMRPRLSYSMNGFLGAGDETENLVITNGIRQMPKVTSVKCPSAILFVTEENTWTITKAVYNIQVSRDAWNDMYFMPAKYGNGDSVATFHKAHDSKLITGVSNVLFVDFHVEEQKAYDEEDMIRKSSSKSWNLVTRNP